MTLAAIVVTFNSEVCIDPLLDSVAQAGVDEIVVVDNGSTDATVARVQQHEGVRLVRSMNVGYAGGINQGVRAAPEAHAYLVLNPDLVIEPGAAEALAAALEEPGVGITVPVVLTSDGRRQDSLRREPTLLRAIGLNGTGVPLFSEYVTGDDAYSRPRDVDWALGHVQPWLLRGGRPLGRVVLPLLGGDRLLSACARRGLANALRAAGRGRPSRGRLGPERRHPPDADPQQGEAVRATPRPHRCLGLLGRDDPLRGDLGLEGAPGEPGCDPGADEARRTTSRAPYGQRDFPPSFLRYFLGFLRSRTGLLPSLQRNQ
jgi:hypothetical protein